MFLIAEYTVAGGSISTVIGSMGSAMVLVGMIDPSMMNGILSPIFRIPVKQISWKIFLATVAGGLVITHLGLVVRSSRTFIAPRESMISSRLRPLTTRTRRPSESSLSSVVSTVITRYDSFIASLVP